MSAHKGNTLVLILAGISILAVAAAGYFFWQNQTLQNIQTYTPPATNNPPRPPTPAPTTQDETANWKTYINDQMGVTFKYPRTFKSTGTQELRVSTEDTNHVTIGVPQTDLVVFLTKYESDTVPQSWKGSGCYGEKLTETAQIVSGETAETASCSGGKSVKFVHRGKTYIISGTNDTYNGNLLVDQILSTFKFQ